MNISPEHLLQCNQSEALADASGRIMDLMNEYGAYVERRLLTLLECVYSYIIQGVNWLGVTMFIYRVSAYIYKFKVNLYITRVDSSSLRTYNEW